ncbi:MAG: PBSX family phage terminase large subunit [Candidatus Hodarchaeales archaeon]
MKIFLLILAMILNLNQYLNPNHSSLFQSTNPELIVYGGANAGKTYSIADKLLCQTIWQKDRPLKALVIRKTFPALRVSVLEILEKRANLFKMPFNLNKADWIARCLNMTFIFQSLNNKEDYEKLKSQTDIDFVWINEAAQLREPDYEECLRRLRGGRSAFEQIIIDFNPIGKTSWLYQRFFEKNIGNVEKLRYTILDNHPDYLALKKTQRELQRLKATKNHNPNYYNIYFLGKWGELEGIIFNWDVVDKPPSNPDEIFYGGDFGYSVDPAALIRIYRKANEFWVEEVIYRTGLTNIELGHEMEKKGVKKGRESDISYWDSAEPKSIQELCDMGFTAKPSKKGPDSVIAGIDFLQNQKIHIIDGSENIIREQRSYVRQQDKNGNWLPKPIEFNNHAMSAIRYGIFTHCKRQSGAFAISEVGMRDIWPA